MSDKAKKILAVSIVLVGGLIAVYLWKSSEKTEAPVATEAQETQPKAEGKTPRVKEALRDNVQPPEGANTLVDDDPEGSLRLEGQVVDELGHEVGGVTVFLSSTPPRTTTTEEDGSFYFDKLVSRSYGLTARSDKGVGGPVVAKLTETSDPVLIRLAKGGSLEVEVVDSQNTPIAGATVGIVSMADVVATTDSKGIATLHNLTSSALTVRARAEGYADNMALVFVSADSEHPARQRIQLSKGVSISGKIVDQEGRAIIGAQIVATRVGKLLGHQDPRRDGVRSNELGEFRIERVAPGELQLFAMHHDFAPARGEQIRVGPGDYTGAEITMTAGGLLRGRVVDEDGNAVPNATVNVGAVNVRSQATGRQSIADHEGKFEITGLPRIESLVIASNNMASSQSHRVDFREERRHEDVTLTLDVKGTISGTVVNENGEPVAEAQVQATPDFWSETASNELFTRGPAHATTAGDGSYTLHGLAEGTFRVQASTSLRFDTEGAVTAKTGDTGVQLLLATPGRIVGKVRMSDGSTPELATATIGWLRPTPVVNGEFSITDLRPGRYQVTVRGPDFKPAMSEELQVEAGNTTDAGTIELQTGRSISGLVTDKRGNPVAGARVVIGPQIHSEGDSLTLSGLSDGVLEMQGVRSTNSDDSGRYALRGLEAKKLSIVADHPEIGRSRTQLVPVAGASTSIDLPLLGVGSIRGRVTANGAPKSASVLVSPTDGSFHVVVVSTDDKGDYFVERVVEGESKVSAMLHGVGSGSMSATTTTVVAGKEIRVDLDIQEGNISLAVAVKGENGAAIDNSQIFLFKGKVQVSTGEEINTLFVSKAEDTKMGFSKGETAYTFDKLSPGEMSVCVIPINGDMNDPVFAQKLQRNVATLAVHCSSLTISEGPEKQAFTAVVPPMNPLPEDEP